MMDTEKTRQRGAIMLADDKELLLNSLISHEYHTVVILCISEGTGRTVHAVLPLWKRTLGTVFNYDQAVTNFLMEVSSDINPRSIAESMRISAVERALEKEDLFLDHLQDNVNVGCLVMGHRIA